MNNGRRRVRKAIALLLAVACVSAVSLPAAARDTPIDILNRLEALVFGSQQPGALLPRIERLDRELFG